MASGQLASEPFAYAPSVAARSPGPGKAANWAGVMAPSPGQEGGTLPQVLEGAGRRPPAPRLAAILGRRVVAPLRPPMTFDPQSQARPVPQQRRLLLVMMVKRKWRRIDPFPFIVYKSSSGSEVPSCKFQRTFCVTDARITHFLCQVDMTALLESNCPDLELVARGKVRDLYKADEGTLLFVATDRISAFDVIMKNVTSRLALSNVSHALSATDRSLPTRVFRGKGSY